MSEHYQLSKKNLLAIIIGNALEWYDFVVFSFMMVFIGKLFFPVQDGISSILYATATFGVGFCLRPLGGIILGIFADCRGPKAAMLFIITSMTVATALLVCTPTYSHIGLWATILVVLARLLQGLSASGEFGTSLALLIQLAPEPRKNFYCSWQMVGQLVAMLLGSLMGILLTEHFSTQQIEAWAWRLPFIFGLLLFPIGIFLRNNLHTIPSNNVSSAPKQPKNILQSLSFWNIFIAMGLVTGATVPIYLTISYTPTFAHIYYHFSMNIGYRVCFAGVGCAIVIIPLIGLLADYFENKKIAMINGILFLLSAYPLYCWLDHIPSLSVFLIVQILINSFLGVYLGCFSSMITELFPVNSRTTGVSMSYNLAVMLFGGFAPFIVTWLIQTSGTPLAMVYYLIAALSLTLSAILCSIRKDLAVLPELIHA